MSGLEQLVQTTFRIVNAITGTHGFTEPRPAQANVLSNSIESMSCPRANIIKCLDYRPMARFNFSNLPYVLS
jgi:hypothetical protein